MNNFLLLVDSNKNKFFLNKNEDMVVDEIYKNNSLFFRILRKIVFFLHIPLYIFLFNSWFSNAYKFNTIILFDTGNAKFLARLLRKKCSNSRIIVWYWNSVAKSIHPSQLKINGIELWSFDPTDCNKYNLKYNTQFFPSYHLKRNSTLNTIKHDAFFIGYDKGRIKTLKKLEKILSIKGISFEFYIVGNVKERIPEFGTFYKQKISYPEIIDKYKSSKVIIDIVSPGQQGLSLRPIEALFLKKKLITNNIQIKKYDFYNKTNVFILGVDDENELNNFVSTDFISVYDESYYEINNWIKRF